jgi:long-chain acyl-CoA synthetase
MMNLDDRFRMTVQQQPDRPAIFGPGPQDRLTYGELDAAIAAAAAQLAQVGVRPGTTVGLHYRSGAEYIVSNYAVWRCGGCVVPIPVELAPEEKHEIGRTIALDFLLSERRTLASLASLQRDERQALSFAPLARSGGGAVVAPAVSLRAHPPGFPLVHSAFIRFTSGTTGASKGVVLSHESIGERIAAANEVLRIGPEDRVLWLLSMSYHFAVSIVSYLQFGAAILLLPNHFAPTVLGAAQRHQATLIYGSPAHYAWLADHEAAAPVPSLRLAISTTTALDRRTAEQFRHRFRLPLTQALGIIEVGLPFINLDFAGDRSEAVGRVLPAYELRLEDVGLGDCKEILLRGPGFLDAYYHPWQSRAEIMPDGWFRTGDIGEVDADGCLCLRGRSKDLISVLGMKFFPQEVERVLLAHPAVASACVFARPDSRLGEVPCARVVLKDAAPASPLPGETERGLETELLELCKQRLAGFKVPQGIEFVRNLARTASGKILHRREDDKVTR